MDNVIKKDEFVKIIEDIQKSDMYAEKLNSFFKKEKIDGYIYQPNCVDTSLRLLHLLLEEYDKSDLIETFCVDLDFGKKWKEGSVTTKDGVDIKLKTIEDLYDALSYRY